MKKLTLCLAVLLPLWAAAQDGISPLTEVLVTNARAKADTMPASASATIVPREALTAHRQWSALATLTDLVPSLFVTQRGMMGYGSSTGAAGSITMRGIGGSNGGVMILIDGCPVHNGIYGHSLADALHTSMAERIEVQRNPSSVLYGSGAMGGVINIVTREAATEGVATDVHLAAGSWGTLQGSVTNQVRHSRFSSVVSAQYGRSDNHRPRMGFEQYGGNARLAYDWSAAWRTALDLNITHWNADNPGPEQAPLYDCYQRITRGTASLSATNRHRRTSGTITAFCNWGRHMVNDGHEAVQPSPTEEFRSRDGIVGINAHQRIDISACSRLTAGVECHHTWGHAFYTSVATGEVVATGSRAMQSVNRSMTEGAIFALYQQDLLRHCTIDAGLRYHHHSVTHGEWIPQASLTYRPTHSTTLTWSSSKGFRNPTLREMYLYRVRNAELQPESLVNHELSWQHNIADGKVNYGINLYRTTADNLIIVAEGLNRNTGKVSNWGAELQATWQVNKHWRLNTHHSVVKMKYAMPYTPRYRGHLSASMRYAHWGVVATVSQICHLYTALDGTYADTDGDYTNATLLGCTIHYYAPHNLTLWLRGDNLLAQRYAYISGYTMPRATLMAGVQVHF